MKSKSGVFFCSLVTVFLLIVILFVGIFDCSASSRTVKAETVYYLLVKACTSATAGAVAGEVYLAGGAGYLWEGNVILACYYSEEDVNEVEAAMSAKGVEVSVKKVAFTAFRLPREKAAEKGRILSNAKSADTCSRILYSAANGLEKNTYTQEEGRAALRGVAEAIDGLARGNRGEYYAPWNAELSHISARARELAEGLLFPKDLRYLQVRLALLTVRMCDYFR